MASSEQKGKVQTVLGPVDPGDLGPPTTHEHLLIDFTVLFTPPAEATERGKAFAPVTLENLAWVRYNTFANEDNLELYDEKVAVFEADLFKAQGGGTIVDATTIGIGRDPLALARVSRAAGVHVVMGAGYYVEASHPDDMDERTVDELTRQIIDEVTVGVDDTGVKAGIIGELGCMWPATENEQKVLVAAARAQQETGAAILIHTGRNPGSPAQVLDILTGEGADVKRVIMGHMERTIQDDEGIIELAKTGCVLEYDLFGWEDSHYTLADYDLPNDSYRLDKIKMLIDNGFVSQIVTAHDVFAKSRLVSYGGNGISHILENMVPRMRERGITDEQIDTILVGNPARMLTIT